MNEQRWAPRATVATVVHDGDRYLIVEELSSDSNETVFNQPAGHLEPDESLSEAAVREVREETGWEVVLTGYLGVARHITENGTVYLRHSFVAEPIGPISGAALDDGIIAAHWLTLEQLKQQQARLRSPMVLKTIEQFLSGDIGSLSLVAHA